jgi:putative ABC transport system permease protein
MGAGGLSTLTTNDAEAIEELPTVAGAAPSVSDVAQVIYGARNWSTQITGTTPSYFSVRNWDFAAGAPFTDTDLRSVTRVAILGKTVVDNLFGDENPVGKTIRIKNSPYVVLGVLSAKGQSLMGRDQDDAILIPITTVQRKLASSQVAGSVRFIMVQVKSAEAMPKAEQDIVDLLRQRHRIREGADSDFTVRNLTAMANTAAETTAVMSLMLGIIASISLLVGGIGIMNIMLVSVTERTREIGIRMAIGARSRDILLQFLLEAIIISIFGCLIGVILGIGGALAASGMTGIRVVITISSILLAFTVAAAVGVFFGWYPARQAARLRPIDALRFQ